MLAEWDNPRLPDEGGSRGRSSTQDHKTRTGSTCRINPAGLSLILSLMSSNLLARGDHPNFRKNAPRMEEQMKIFHVGSHQFRESLRELLRELWFSYCSSRGMPFREWNFVFREWNTKFPRVAPRIPRNSPRAPRMAFSLRERFS